MYANSISKGREQYVHRQWEADKSAKMYFLELWLLPSFDFRIATDDEVRRVRRRVHAVQSGLMEAWGCHRFEGHRTSLFHLPDYNFTPCNIAEPLTNYEPNAAKLYTIAGLDEQLTLYDLVVGLLKRSGKSDDFMLTSNEIRDYIRRVVPELASQPICLCWRSFHNRRGVIVVDDPGYSRYILKLTTPDKVDPALYASICTIFRPPGRSTVSILGKTKRNLIIDTLMRSMYGSMSPFAIIGAIRRRHNLTFDSKIEWAKWKGKIFRKECAEEDLGMWWRRARWALMDGWEDAMPVSSVEKRALRLGGTAPTDKEIVVGIFEEMRAKTGRTILSSGEIKQRMRAMWPGKFDDSLSSAVVPVGHLRSRPPACPSRARAHAR
ncbi:uncharacterized protein LOC62_01G001175 [Vanrija pseudolonga]|uniref:Uncharacterized protein n=1 Tax=Vanrija pseudolonga TaxID=143232 RepID=A0AAF0Y0J9_9TREE|nr:hypothetical protein LOC62_01G001175 [Vanrija pseudolonga]WOO77606.1 hypothetical protein LOC62_01G001175 [Vanrija pseudolonga]